VPLKSNNLIGPVVRVVLPLCQFARLLPALNRIPGVDEHRWSIARSRSAWVYQSIWPLSHVRVTVVCQHRCEIGSQITNYKGSHLWRSSGYTDPLVMILSATVLGYCRKQAITAWHRYVHFLGKKISRGWNFHGLTSTLPEDFHHTAPAKNLAGKRRELRSSNTTSAFKLTSPGLTGGAPAEPWATAPSDRMWLNRCFVDDYTPYIPCFPSKKNREMLEIQHL